jgi:hypothetical protein
MAYFAELDENNIVLRVISVNNHMILDDDNIEQEHLGISFCQSLLGGNWLQTSYNTIANTHAEGKQPFRKNYAGIDFTYNQTLDAFIPPQPDSFYILDEDTCTWYDPLYEPLTIGVSRV